MFVTVWCDSNQIIFNSHFQVYGINRTLICGLGSRTSDSDISHNAVKFSSSYFVLK